MAKSKQDKYTRSAQGKECTVRIPGVCNFNEETTVLAHLNGAGMGMKNKNIHGAYSCSSCHLVIDGQAKSEYSSDEIKLMHLEAVIRTQNDMIDNGILKL